jgi:CBS domain containing-hemolysin-like protein
VALSHAERTARFLYWPMLWILGLFYPLVRILNGAGNLCLRAMGIRRAEGGGERGYTPEELQIIVEESAEGGAMRAEAGSILSELLEFGDLTAGQVMVPRVRVIGIPLTATPAEMRSAIATHHHTRYPIYDGDLDHIVGMLHVKDLLRPILDGEALSKVVVRPMPVVPVTATLDAVLRTMQKSSAHLAIVIDEHGGTAGVVSLEDLFEEVVGEIDEGLPYAPPLVAAPDGSAMVVGTLRLDELGRHFDLDLAHDEVDSVSGLILALLGRPPAVGDVVEFGRVRLEVTATMGRGVRQARAILLRSPESD